jgi:DnaJ-class molecular chaperone
MTQCPDCDSIKMFSADSEGDGKCSVCHGTGFGGFLEMFFEPVTTQSPECEECRGTGRCQTCAGLGMVEEYELSLAA